MEILKLIWLLWRVLFDGKAVAREINIEIEQEETALLRQSHKLRDWHWAMANTLTFLGFLGQQSHTAAVKLSYHKYLIVNRRNFRERRI